MKRINDKSLCAILALCVLYAGIAWLVFRLSPWPNRVIGLLFLTACLCVAVATVIIRDSLVAAAFDQDMDVRTLVLRSFNKHLDNRRQISEETFLGPKEPTGYVHVFLSDRERSFQLFFSTTSDLSKANRIARSALMSLDGCDVVDTDVSKCGMSGFEAVSEARNELYYVSVYQNPHTKHIRVYVCVQTPYPPGRVSEPV